MLLFCAVALAGELKLDDPTQRLSAADTEALTEAVQPLPFAVHAVVDDSAETETKLAAEAKALREAEGGLVVAVDPSHRHTAVELDASVGVERANFATVRAAGDASFREGAWGAGLVAIVEATAARRGVRAPGAAAHREPDLVDVVAFFAFVGAVVCFGGALGVVHLRSRRDRFRSSGSSSSSHSRSSSGDSGGSSGSW